MNRRAFILGLGALAGGGSLAASSGAVSSVSADRRLTVETADDNVALLALEERGSGTRSVDDGSVVAFSFPGLRERLSNPDLGLGSDSVYEFDRDASAGGTDGLLRIENRGTQSVEVYSEHQTSSDLAIELYDVTDPNDTALRDDPPELGVGEFVDVGVRIRTFGASIGTFDETLTIVAEAVSE